MACNECMAISAVRAHRTTILCYLLFVGLWYYLWHICIVSTDTDGWQQAHGHRIFQKGKIIVGGAAIYKKSLCHPHTYVVYSAICQLLTSILPGVIHSKSQF